MRQAVIGYAAATLLWGCQKQPPYADDTAAGGGSDSGSSGPFTCGELAPPPDLAVGEWELGSQPPAGGLISIVEDAAGGALYAGSHNAGAWRSEDGGESWTWLPTGITHTLADLYVPPGQPGVLFRSSGGTLERSADGGETFQPSEVGVLDPEQPAQLVLGIGGPAHDGERVYLLTSDGTAWLSTDAGLTFEEQGDMDAYSDPDEMFYLRHVAWRILGEGQAGDPVLATDSQTVWASTDGLQTWTPVLEGALAGGTLVRNPVDSDHVVMGTSLGDLHVSRDGGLTWSSDPYETGRHLHAAAFSADGSTLYVVAHDTFHVSTDGGETLSEVDSPLELAMALWAGEEGVLAGDDQGLWRSTDDGASWRSSDPGMNDIGMVVVTPHPECPDRAMLGSRCSGGVFATADWGESWTHRSGDFHYVMGLHHDPQDPRRVWAVSDDALYLSEDGGETWEMRYLSYHYHGLAIHPEDPDRLLIGSVGSGEYADDRGRVYLSEDGGRSWTDSSTGLPDSEASMHTLLHWPGKPEVVLLGTYKGGDVSHQGGAGVGLFRSEDSGASWSKTDLPVDDIAWLTEWGGESGGPAAGVVAATGDGLWLTEDEGLSWRQLEGPEGWLLGADFDGMLGYTMAREGGVWETTDGGESWTEISPDTWWDSTTWLGAVAITPAHEEAGARFLWLTIYNNGVWRRRIE